MEIKGRPEEIAALLSALQERRRGQIIIDGDLLTRLEPTGYFDGGPGGHYDQRKAARAAHLVHRAQRMSQN